MSYMTCPTCQTDDDVKVMHGSPPRLWVKCGRCRARWNVTVPGCGPGRHDWRDLTRTSSGRSPRQKCSVCGQTRVSPHA